MFNLNLVCHACVHQIEKICLASFLTLFFIAGRIINPTINTIFWYWSREPMDGTKGSKFSIDVKSMYSILH